MASVPEDQVSLLTVKEAGCANRLLINTVGFCRYRALASTAVVNELRAGCGHGCRRNRCNRGLGVP
jgi:hypothetical protein